MKVSLRLPVEADIAVHRHAPSSAEIAKMFGATTPPPASDERSRGWFDWLSGHQFGRVIECNGRAVGEIRLHSVDEANRSARLAVGLLEERDLNKGIGRRAIGQALEHGFDQMGLHRIDLKVLAINARAIACYVACGFKHEGRLRDAAWLDGVWVDDCIMAILAHEYREFAR